MRLLVAKPPLPVIRLNQLNIILVRSIREKAATNFRLRKNEETYSNRLVANREFRDSLCPNVEGLDAILASLTFGLPTSQPPREVTLSYSDVPRPCKGNRWLLCGCKNSSPGGLCKSPTWWRHAEGSTKPPSICLHTISSLSIFTTTQFLHYTFFPSEPNVSIGEVSQKLNYNQINSRTDNKDRTDFLTIECGVYLMSDIRTTWRPW